MDAPQLHPAWKNAVAVFLRSEPAYGHLLTKEWLYSNFGLAMPQGDTPHAKAQAAELRFVKEFTAFRNELLDEHQLYLETKPGVGYVVAEPSEQTRLAVDHGLNGVRKALLGAVRGAVNVRLEELTPEQQKMNADALAKLAALRTTVRRAGFGRLLLTNKHD